MQHKQKVDQLLNGVRSLFAKNGYAFSEEDKALLENILVELEEMLNNQKGNSPDQMLKTLFLVLKFLKFFGIDDITGLF
jgi:predicted component of type VI protein secretion system